ncbi:beta-lactamase hydrolase-like, partial [Kipferlia bialata]
CTVGVALCLIMVYACLATVSAESVWTAVSKTHTPIPHHDIPNLSEIDNIFFAGQPSYDALADACEEGVRSVIDIRPHSERDWDEAELMADYEDVEYYHVPFASPESLTDEVFDSLLGHLDSAPRPVLFHCKSANRYGRRDVIVGHTHMST